jgi:chromate transporter
VNFKLLWQIALGFASLSLVSVGGGNAILPAMHRQVVEATGWMSDATFANLFAISQAAPGPNMMVIALIGWHLCGLAGLAVAMLSFVLPSSTLAFFVGRLVERRPDARWVAPVKQGLVPVAIGLTLAGGVVMARAADHGMPGVAITALAALFVIASDRNPVWALAAGAVLSMLGLGH